MHEVCLVVTQWHVYTQVVQSGKLMHGLLSLHADTRDCHIIPSRLPSSRTFLVMLLLVGSWPEHLRIMGTPKDDLDALVRPPLPSGPCAPSTVHHLPCAVVRHLKPMLPARAALVTHLWPCLCACSTPFTSGPVSDPLSLAWQVFF